MECVESTCCTNFVGCLDCIRRFTCCVDENIWLNAKVRKGRAYSSSPKELHPEPFALATSNSKHHRSPPDVRRDRESICPPPIRCKFMSLLYKTPVLKVFEHPCSDNELKLILTFQQRVSEAIQLPKQYVFLLSC